VTGRREGQGRRGRSGRRGKAREGVLEEREKDFQLSSNAVVFINIITNK